MDGRTWMDGTDGQRTGGTEDETGQDGRGRIGRTAQTEDGTDRTDGQRIGRTWTDMDGRKGSNSESLSSNPNGRDSQEFRTFGFGTKV